MDIIRPDGAPIATEKTVHEPRAFRRDRDQLEAECERLIGEFIQDIEPKPDGHNAAQPDVQAARRRYGHEYAQLVHKLKAHNVGLQADDQLVYKQIDIIIAHQDLKKRMATPMDELAGGLRHFNFLQIGTIPFGAAWLAVNGTHWVVIAIGDGGLCALWHDVGDVPEGLLHQLAKGKRRPQAVQPKWTMGEVTLLIRAMRWQKLHLPERAQLDSAQREPRGFQFFTRR